MLALLLVAGLATARTPAAPPAAGPPSLAQALNPDGTLRPGVAGAFDARRFTMGAAPDGRPLFRPSGPSGAGDFRWANGFGLPNGTNGEVRAVVRANNGDVYIGGSFTAVDSVVANGVARWNGTAWSSLGAGTANGVRGRFNAQVRALALAGNGDLYVGGDFAQAGGNDANGVARWNGTAWSSLGTGTANGVGGVVYALALAGNGEVYAGGFFAQAGGLAASGVARWDGTAWRSLGTGTANGVGGNVYALALAGNGDLYAGGYFGQGGGSASNGVARWDGTAWSSLSAGTGNRLAGLVYALAVAGNGDLYAGGAFTQAGGSAANNVARWNGTAWSSVGTPIGVNAQVLVLAVAASGDLYAGGYFAYAGGVAASRVARWDGTAWSPLGTGTANGVDAAVFGLAVGGSGEVYAGGDFGQAGGSAASHMAWWSGTAWSSLGTGTGAANGVNGLVSALAVAGNGDVYVGGNFTQAGGSAANNIAKWNGTAWSSLGTGAANGVSGDVFALAVAGNGDVYAGGNFFRAGGLAASHVARWNGTAWNSLGTGAANGVNGDVYALTVAGNGDVYVGGGFFQAGGNDAGSVARWSGTAWSSLGTGLANGVDGAVTALAVAATGEVYAGGYFAQAGGSAANYLARWNGAAWSSLGTGNRLDGPAFALAVAGNGDLYAGGHFTQAGGSTANNVARWDGTAWSSLGTGPASGVVGYGVYALALAGNGEVYAGGDFAQAGGHAATGVARWDGMGWSSLGTGLNGGVFGLAIAATNRLYAGGDFGGVGDNSKVSACFARYTPAAVSATRAPAPAAFGLFPNPAHGRTALRLRPGTPPQALVLLDALGRELRRYPAPAGPEATLDLRGLPAGVYVLRYGRASQRLVVE